MAHSIRPVTHGQTRFVVPGLLADTQGVAFGPEAAVLLPTLGHLVGFLRSVGREQPLKTALPDLALQRARIAGGGPVVLAEFSARGRHSLDRSAALARLHQGQLFTGMGQHLVRYRDAGAAKGYDATSLSREGPFRTLYDRPISRDLERPRPLPFDSLVRQLTLGRQHEQQLHPEMFVRAPSVLLPRLVRHLGARGATLGVAILEEEDQAAAPEALISARRVRPGIWPLIQGLPRVRIYRREHPRIFVEAGYAHPLDLAGCASLLSGDRWLFFDAAGRVSEAPPNLRFVSGGDLVQPALARPDEASMLGLDAAALAGEPLRYDLRMGPRVGSQGPCVARLLRGPRALEWLRRMVYLAPPSAFEGHRVVAWEDTILVIGSEGANALPVGEPLRSPTRDVYLPVDQGLSPNLPPRVLKNVVAPRGAALLLPEGGFRWATEAELPLERTVLSNLPLADVRALSMPDSPQPTVVPTDENVFRLFVEEFR